MIDLDFRRPFINTLEDEKGSRTFMFLKLLAADNYLKYISKLARIKLYFASKTYKEASIIVIEFLVCKKFNSMQFEFPNLQIHEQF